MLKLICKFCGKTFYRSSRRVYCSKECMIKSFKKSKAIIICLNCGKTFQGQRHKADRKFCCAECSYEYHSKRFTGEIM